MRVRRRPAGRKRDRPSVGPSSPGTWPSSSDIPLVVKKTRNPVARSPLLRKGGRHDKSNSAKRTKEKKTLRSEVQQTQTRHGGRER